MNTALPEKPGMLKFKKIALIIVAIACAVVSVVMIVGSIGLIISGNKPAAQSDIGDFQSLYAIVGSIGLLLSGTAVACTVLCVVWYRKLKQPGIVRIQPLDKN